MVEVFTNSLYKIYSIDTIKEETKAKLDEEIKNYRMSIFKANDMNEVKISNMKKLQDAGILVRHGADKNGWWEVIEQ